LDWAGAQGGLGSVLLRLGARESGTAKLEEAVVTYGKALTEQTRERVPLAWAWSRGGQGVALMFLAERRTDAAMAETAISQINTAIKTLLDGGDAPRAVTLEQTLPWARAIVERLRGG